MACLKRLTQIEPTHTGGWQNLAVALFMRNRHEEGITACHQAIKSKPNNTSAMFNIALAHERLGQYDAAMEWVAKALLIDPAEQSLLKLEFRIKLLKIRGRMMKALRHLWPWRRK